MAPRDPAETMTESMVGAVDTAYLTKRKADSDPVEEFEESGGGEIEESDDDDDDGYIDSDDELIEPTWFKVPEWGEDSFDEFEYDSSKENNEFSNDEDERNWRRFKRQLVKNKGFSVDPELSTLYPYSRYKSVSDSDLELPAGLGQTYREYFAEMACLCLQRYNQENSQKNGFNVEFVEVVSGNYTSGSRSKTYITFMAREKPDGPLVEYQAKVWCTLVKNENYPILCRPASAVKPSNQN